MKTFAVPVVVLAAAGAFVSFGPPGLYARAGTPDFCASCHVMEGEEDRNCRECHRRLSHKSTGAM